MDPKPVYAAITSPRNIEYLPHPFPSEIPAGHVLVCTIHTLVSPGTELSLYQGTHPGLPVPGNTWAKYPFKPGYAAVGEVLQSRDATGDFKPGDRVFYWGHHASWQLVNSAEEVLVPIPAGLDLKHAVFARFAQISATAVVRLPVNPASVLVIGGGIIGLMAAMLFRAKGADVVVQDINPHRLTIAEACGLRTHLAGDNSEAVRAKFGDNDPECVIEATGVRGMVRDALRAVAWRGCVVLLGSPGGLQEMDLYGEIFVKGALLLGAHEGTIPCVAPEGTISRRSLAIDALAAISNGTMNVAPLITGEFLAAELNEAYAALSADKDHNLGTLISW